MANWTTPKTWTSEILTSANLNTHVRDNITYAKEMGEVAGVGFIFDNGGADIVVGTRYVAFASGPMTILGSQAESSDIASDNSISWAIRRLADSDGDAAFDSDHEIVSAITLDSDTGVYDRQTSATDWATGISQYDRVEFIVTACSGVTHAAIQLNVQKLSP